jgi:hypothetical protein
MIQQVSCAANLGLRLCLVFVWQTPFRRCELLLPGVWAAPSKSIPQYPSLGLELLGAGPLALRPFRSPPVPSAWLSSLLLYVCGLEVFNFLR